MWGVQLALAITITIVALVWLALVGWTVRDAMERLTSRPLIIGVCLMALLLPFLGTLVWALLRPQEVAEDAYARALELQVLAAAQPLHCANCAAPARDEHQFCPYCAARLRRECPQCDGLVDPSWHVCGFCGMHLNATQEGA